MLLTFSRVSLQVLANMSKARAMFRDTRRNRSAQVAPSRRGKSTSAATSRDAVKKRFRADPPALSGSPCRLILLERLSPTEVLLLDKKKIFRNIPVVCLYTSLNDTTGMKRQNETTGGPAVAPSGGYEHYEHTSTRPQVPSALQPVRCVVTLLASRLEGERKLPAFGKQHGLALCAYCAASSRGTHKIL